MGFRIEHSIVCTVEKRILLLAGPDSDVKIEGPNGLNLSVTRIFLCFCCKSIVGTEK